MGHSHSRRWLSLCASRLRRWLAEVTVGTGKTTTPRVVAISPPTPGPWLRQLHRLAEAGVDALILRLLHTSLAEVRLPDDLPLPTLLRPRGPEEIGQRPDLGLHLPASIDPASVPAAGRGLRSAACHDAAELQRAAAAGVDFVLLSPVFSPGSKPDDRRPTLGLEGLHRLAEGAAVPVLALGGIDARCAPAVLRSGLVAGVAGISAFFTPSGEVDGPAAQALVRAARSASVRSGGADRS